MEYIDTRQPGDGPPTGPSAAGILVPVIAVVVLIGAAVGGFLLVRSLGGGDTAPGTDAWPVSASGKPVFYYFGSSS